MTEYSDLEKVKKVRLSPVVLSIDYFALLCHTGDVLVPTRLSQTEWVHCMDVRTLSAPQELKLSDQLFGLYLDVLETLEDWKHVSPRMPSEDKMTYFSLRIESKF